jgi:hypothetical protein
MALLLSFKALKKKAGHCRGEAAFSGDAYPRLSRRISNLRHVEK